MSSKDEKNINSKSGLEYIDIDNNDVIQVRRIINKPKENFPWPIFTLAIISIIIAAIFVTIGFIGWIQMEITYI